MSRVVSFGNIVNSLRAVRNDYNEHLKAVPQYEAFLLVESSTQKVADTLRDVAPEMAADVVEALETAKAKFRQHLTSVAEYRALLAIDKLISDVAADLGAQPDAEAEPVSANLESTHESAQVERAAPAQEAVAQTEIAKPILAQAEVAEQAPTSVEAVVQAQAGADAELISAEAISQIRTTLQSAEGSVPSAQTGLAEHAGSAPTELAAPTPTPETQWVTPLPPAIAGREEEKAA